MSYTGELHTTSSCAKTIFSGGYMSQLKEQYERETGKCWHLNHQTYLLPAEGYVNWLEAKVENGSSHNKQSTPCSKCGTDRVLMCPNRKCDASPF